jgi:hypothetical protein
MFIKQEPKGKIIRNPCVAAFLHSRGANLVKMKAQRENPEATAYVFEDNATLSRLLDAYHERKKRREDDGKYGNTK